ncbi:MAG: RNA polymerase sigma factor [Dehalococcoidia bacterium]
MPRGADVETAPAGQSPAGGNAAAFERVYRENVRKVYAYVYARLGNHHDAEDVTEDTFLRAWGAFARYEERGLPIVVWLLRIATNCVVDFRRKRRPQGLSPLEEALSQPEPSPGPQELAEVGQTREQLRSLLQRLPPDYQQVIVLRYWAGLDSKEMAQAMGRSEGAVKALLYRATKALREMVAGQGPETL